MRNEMSAITPLMPRQKVPALSVPLVGGGTWSLADQSPENFTMVVFYRGLHCPI
jgi:peroxiredoxin